MQNKFIGFIRDLSFSLFMIAFGFGSLYTFSSSLHVTCELQSDETYTCVARDELFGWGPIKTQANNVAGIEWELKCKNNNKGGCAYVSQFQTTTEEKVKLSNLFTDNKEKVEELVQNIDTLMKEKSPSIDYTGKKSMLLGGSLFFCLTPILLFVPFLRLIPSTKGGGPKTLISWGPKEK
jgi:hypothetical protein